MAHHINLCFAAGEPLRRAIGRRDVLKAKSGSFSVKGQSLRLQVSVFRGAKEDLSAVILRGVGKERNGVAEIAAVQARGVLTERILSVCIDEPLHDIDSHALIALTSEATPGELSEDEVDKARNMLAERLRVVHDPVAR